MSKAKIVYLSDNMITLEALIAIALSLVFIAIISILRYLIIDIQKINNIKKEIELWEIERKKAIEEKNIKKYRRVMRKEKRIKKLKEELEKENLKGSIVSALLWIFIINIYGMFFPSGLNIVFPLINYPATFFMIYIMISLWWYPIANQVLTFLFSKKKYG
ncbi:MAG: hypothetical protein DRJ32_00160 [Thermoprotei archaeon]|nr:MAG: hypothetical protein DRJ32_00160 [Thermoprotei archaeon]